MKTILMKPGLKTKLSNSMGVSRPTVRKALNYQSDNELSRKIRYVAIKEFGGIISE